MLITCLVGRKGQDLIEVLSYWLSSPWPSCPSHLTYSLILSLLQQATKVVLALMRFQPDGAKSKKKIKFILRSYRYEKT
jgi:hypothetical protein